MLCYRDRTFCSFHATCLYGGDCPRAYTDKVKTDADAFGLGVSVFMDKPECWQESAEAFMESMKSMESMS